MGGERRDTRRSSREPGGAQGGPEAPPRRSPGLGARPRRGTHAPAAPGLCALALLVFAVGSGACASTAGGGRQAEPPRVVEAGEDELAVGARVASPDGRFVAVERPDSDAFSAAFLFRAGPAFDPPGLEGLTALTLEAATLETEGDPDRLTSPHRRALLLGGRLEFVSDGAVAGWRVEGPAREGAGLLRLLRDVALAPRFPATRVEARAEMRREALTQARGGLEGLAAGWAIGLALAQGRSLALSPPDATLLRVHREDVLRHHARLVSERPAVVVVEGAPVDLARQIFRAMPAPPRGPDRAPTWTCDDDFQLWMSAPEHEAIAAVALRVPGPGHPLRLALEEVLAEVEAVAGSLPPAVSLHDRDDAGVLVLTVPGDAPEPFEIAEGWLRRAAELAAAGGPRVGWRLSRAERLLHAESPRRRALMAGRHALGLGYDPGASVAGYEGRRVIAGILSDVDRRIRVALGADPARRALARWGPVRALTRALSLCTAEDS